MAKKQKQDLTEEVMVEQVEQQEQQEQQEETKYEYPKLEQSVLRMYAPLLFKVQPEIFDGAFYGLEGNYSVPEAREIIKNYLKREIKN